MPKLELRKENCQYGAPMGRWNGMFVKGTSQELSNDIAIRVYLEAVSLDSGGYDKGGAYWGWHPGGERLYRTHYTDNAVDFQDFFHAKNRTEAKEKIKATYPNVTFVRG